MTSTVEDRSRPFPAFQIHPGWQDHKVDHPRHHLDPCRSGRIGSTARKDADIESGKVIPLAAPNGLPVKRAVYLLDGHAAAVQSRLHTAHKGGCTDITRQKDTTPFQPV